MAIYPIKMLKDEQGNPFVPLTHISAVAGEEYTTTVLIAEKQSAGHYKITNSDLTSNLIRNKVIAVKIDDVSGATMPSYFKLNNEAEYPVYKADGANYLNLEDIINSVAFFTFTGNKYQLLLVGADSQGGSAHGITDGDGNLMPQRGVLNFNGAEVVDLPGSGATSIRTEWISQKISLKTDTTTASLWQPMLASAISLPQTGTYKISIYLRVEDIISVGKEFGIRIKKNSNYIDNPVWKYQYKRLRDTFTFYGSFNSGDTMIPELYIDTITGTSTTTITDAYMYIEYIPTKEVD